MKIRRITNFERRSCLGKIKHNSILAAQNHLDELKAVGNNPHTLNFYHCQFCKGYHCGNKTI